MLFLQIGIRALVRRALGIQPDIQPVEHFGAAGLFDKTDPVDLNKGVTVWEWGMSPQTSLVVMSCHSLSSSKMSLEPKPCWYSHPLQLAGSSHLGRMLSLKMYRLSML